MLMMTMIVTTTTKKNEDIVHISLASGALFYENDDNGDAGDANYYYHNDHLDKYHFSDDSNFTLKSCQFSAVLIQG